MNKSAKNILWVFGLGVCFLLIFFVASKYFFQNTIINEAKAVNTITCSVEPFSIKPGENVTITADVNFDASDVWAMIEGNDGVAQTHYTLIESPANHWEKTYTAAATATGLYDMALYASVNGTGEQILCNPSEGSSWIKKTLSSMPWHARNGHEVLTYGGYLWILGGLVNDYDNDVWRSQDGENWELITADAPWPGRKSFGSAVFDPDGSGGIPLAMIIFGGDAYVGNNTRVFYNDVWWSTNGRNWIQLDSADWSVRGLFATTVYDGKIWISGGYNGTTIFNQIWSTSNPSSGWDQVSLSSGFGNLTIHQMLPYNDGNGEKLWILGGYQRYCSGGTQNGQLCNANSECGTGYYCVGTSKNDVWQATTSSATSWTHLRFCQAGVRVGQKCSYLCTGGSNNGNACVVSGDCPSGTCGDTSGFCTGSTCGFAPPWSARNDFSTAVFDYSLDFPDKGNKILVMAGADNNSAILNDAWSYQSSEGWQVLVDPSVPDHNTPGSEPSTWTNWTSRIRAKAVIHNRGGSEELFFIGGVEPGYRSWNDVWTTTNGTTWDLIGDNYDGIFNSRWASSMAGFDGKLWIMGGHGKNDVWSSPDGVDWTQEIADGNTDYWSKRWGHKTLIYNNKLWLIGGCRAGSGGGGIYCGGICNNGAACTKGADCSTGTCNEAGLNDVWTTENGTTWTNETATTSANFRGRYEFATAVFDDGDGEKMWILGGDVSGKCAAGQPYAGSICRNDTSCGGTSGSCSKVCIAGSHIGDACTTNAYCDIVPSDGRGNCDFFSLNDVLSSTDGVDWTLATADAAWLSRGTHCAIGYDSKLWVMAGFHRNDGSEISTYLNDVWSSPNGINWTPATDNAAWNDRHTPALVEYRGKMWVYGGNNGYFSNIPGSKMDSNNVWWSTDGATWNQATGWAEWDGRDFFSYTIFQDRMWLMGGDSMGSGNNDVWASRYGDMTYYVVPEKYGIVNITATVEPELSLSLSANSCSFGSLDATNIKTCGYNVSVATNAQSGYTGSISQNHGFETNVNGVTHEIEGENDTPLQIDASGALSGEFGEYGIGIQTADTTDWPEFTGICSDYNNQAVTSLPAKAVDWSTLADPDAYLGDNIENIFATNSEPVDGVNDGLTYFCHGVRITWDAPPGSYDQLVTITVVGNF